MSITMGVSAFWHGVYPGYYLSMLTVPLVAAAEDFMRPMRDDLTTDFQRKVYDCFNWFFKMRMFDYMCMAFILLSLEDTMRYWHSIYYFGHIVTIIVMMIGLLYRSNRRKSKIN